MQMLRRRGDAVRGFRDVIDVEGWRADQAVYAVILGHLAARQTGDEPAAKAFLDDAAGKLDAVAYPVVQFLRRRDQRTGAPGAGGRRRQADRGPLLPRARLRPQKTQGRGAGSLPMGERARQPELRRVHDRAGGD